MVFESAGELWLLPDLGSDAVKLDISLGSASQARRPALLKTARHLGAVIPDHTGSSSAVEAHGTIHWLRHKDGPSRVVEATPGVRARLPRPLGEGRIAYVADHDGVEALYLNEIAPQVASAQAAPAARPQPAAAGAGAGDTPLPKPVPASGMNRPGVESPAADDSAPDVRSRRRRTAATRPAETLPQHRVPTGAGDVAGGAPADAALAAGGGAVAGRAPQEDRFPQAHPGQRHGGQPGRPHGWPWGPPSATSTWPTPGPGPSSSSPASARARIDGLSWSPDSAWLGWSEPVTSFGSRSRLRIVRVDDPEFRVVDVTDGRFRDDSPSFTPDGKFLAFLSNRSFDPVYDGHSFDLSFPSPIKPYLVALAADTPSPFGPSVDLADGPDGRNRPGRRGEQAGGTGDGVPAVRVDAEGLAHRVIGVPVPQGNYSALEADARRFALAGQRTRRRHRRRPGHAWTTRTPHPDWSASTWPSARRPPSWTPWTATGSPATAEKVVFLQDKQIRVAPADAKADEDSGQLVKVDLSRIRVLMDPLSVWGQAFDEAWRLQRDFFWTEDMAGQDWESVHRRYRPIVDRLGSHDDLVDLLWELHGELGTSHAYVRPVAVTENGSNGQGRLGADLAFTGAGWEITRILAGESSDPLATSPLTRPGADAKAGDILLAIDGVELSETLTPAMQLVGAAGRAVELTLRNGAAHGEAAGDQRRIAVVPVKDEERLRYQEWVAGNRRTVREASGGTFGYLHIPDMMANGWAQLHRDLDTETALDGLIVDVRRNRGGHTSQLVAELIGRKVTGWSMPRGEKPRTYPHHAPRGPVVILTDEFAGSDGDIITQVSKLRGIGPVIGTRTWGGVVGIDNRFSLADGTGVTQPRYATWFSGGVGWGVENFGVTPDIEVTFPPHAYAAGRDPQLEYGIGALKEMIQELPTDRPPLREGYRRLLPAPLPARSQPGLSRPARRRTAQRPRFLP